LKFVLKLVLFSLPTILALTFPFATLVGALMAVGRLSADNEILAMQCAGISLKRISFPFIFIGFIFTLFSFSINDYLIPLGNLHYKKLYREIFLSNPTLELDSWSVRQMEKRILITGVVKDDTIDQMLIIDKGQSDKKTIIVAQGASIESGDQLGDVLSIHLEQVENLVSYQRERDRYSYTRASSMTYNFLLSQLTDALGDPTPAEMRSVDLLRGIREKNEVYQNLIDQWKLNLWSNKENLQGYYSRIAYSSPGRRNDNTQQRQQLFDNIDTAKNRRPQDRNLDFWRMEFYQKFAIPFSCIPFVILAFPLGIMSRRSGRTFGFLAGLILTFLYWAFLIVGRSLVMRAGIAPFLSIWTSNILLLIIGLIVYFKKAAK
ncbi:MAG: LptF/LptG family permease, partial [Spirochaetaceae bacterium]|nr:LptF/LptG family permease [Spirochaetaceae bacterium]